MLMFNITEPGEDFSLTFTTGPRRRAREKTRLIFRRAETITKLAPTFKNMLISINYENGLRMLTYLLIEILKGF